MNSVFTKKTLRKRETKLLEKVEELSFYIIQLSKRLKQLENEKNNRLLLISFFVSMIIATSCNKNNNCDFEDIKNYTETNPLFGYENYPEGTQFVFYSEFDEDTFNLTLSKYASFGDECFYREQFALVGKVDFKKTKGADEIKKIELLFGKNTEVAAKKPSTISASLQYGWFIDLYRVGTYQQHFSVNNFQLKNTSHNKSTPECEVKISNRDSTYSLFNSTHENNVVDIKMCSGEFNDYEDKRTFVGTAQYKFNGTLGLNYFCINQIKTEFTEAYFREFKLIKIIKP